MKARTSITIAVLVTAMGMVALTKAVPQPLSWGSPVQGTRIGVVTSGGIDPFFLIGK